MDRERHPDFEIDRTRAGREDVASWMRQLSGLVGSGVPLSRSLELLIRQEPKRSLRRVWGRMLEMIQSGHALSDAMTCFPGVFDGMTVQGVHAGERVGVLSEGLKRMAAHLQSRVRLTRKVRGAMAYPLTVAVLALAIVGALVVGVIPRFEVLYEGLLKGAPLPGPTRWVMAFSRALQHNGLAVLCGLVVLAVGLPWVLRLRGVRGLLDRLLLHLPIWGGVERDMAFVRVARGLATMLAGGQPMLDAVDGASAVAGNRAIADAMRGMRRGVEEGESLARLMAEHPFVPPMLAGLMEIGEETGRLPAMLEEAADDLEEKVQDRMTTLVALLEPAMIVVLALLAGFLVIAMFLPIVGVIEGLSG